MCGAKRCKCSSQRLSAAAPAAACAGNAFRGKDRLKNLTRIVIFSMQMQNDLYTRGFAMPCKTLNSHVY